MSLFLRIFFRLLYHDFAFLYDFISAFVSGGRWREWTSSILPLAHGRRVLELGFGPGHLLLKYLLIGISAVGLDDSQQMINLAKTRLRKKNFSPDLVRGLGQSLPFCAQSFDCVVATFPTGFIFQASALQDIRRILKPGGSLVILLSAWITDRSLFSRFLSWLFRITGQSLSDQVQEETILKPFLDAGLDARLHWAALRDSRLSFVIAVRV